MAATGKGKYKSNYKRKRIYVLNILCVYVFMLSVYAIISSWLCADTNQRKNKTITIQYVFSGFILKLCIYNTRAQNAFLVHFEYLPSWKVSCTCYKYASYTCTFYTWTYYTPVRLYFLHLYFLYFFTSELVIHMYIYISYTYLYFLPLYSLNLFCVKHILLT